MEKELKFAVYGALQRLIKKINKKYPITTEEFFPELEKNFSVPDRFFLTLSLNPNILSNDKDYTSILPEVGNQLLVELLLSEEQE